MEFYIISGIKAALVAFVLLTTLAYLQWVERKVIAHIQLRMGPSRVGPHGLLQPLADVVKLLTKEDLLPPHVNQFYYLLAPFLAASIALAAISVIPFGPEIEVFAGKDIMQQVAAPVKGRPGPASLDQLDILFEQSGDGRDDVFKPPRSRVGGRPTRLPARGRHVPGIEDQS